MTKAGREAIVGIRACRRGTVARGRNLLAAAGRPRVMVPLLIASLGSLLGAELWASDEAPRACDPEHGRQVFAKCAICHALGDFHPAATSAPAPGILLPLPFGPDLRGVLGRQAGTAPGFQYSRAMRESGVVWTRDQLLRYLEDPLAAIPENRMPFAGLKRAEDREAVACYLEESSHE